jgi:uncharacterized membrane protein
MLDDDEAAEPGSVSGDDVESSAELDPSTSEAVDSEVVDGHAVQDGADASMVRAVRMLSEHQGPLPSEQWLTTVEQLEPGTTRRLVDDFVAGREHERTIQARAVEIDRENFNRFARYQTLQLVAAWSTVVIIAAGGITLIATGHAIGGLVALVTELAILAGVFVGRQVIQSRQPRETKADNGETPPSD